MANVERAAAPRKKKITRLVPPEEPLAPIEEVTDRSEDSSIISESHVNTYRPSGRPAKTSLTADLHHAPKAEHDRKDTNQQTIQVQRINAMTTDGATGSRDSAPKPPPSRSKEASGSASSTVSSNDMSLSASSAVEAEATTSCLPTKEIASAANPASESKKPSPSRKAERSSSGTSTTEEIDSDETANVDTGEEKLKTPRPSLSSQLADPAVADTSTSQKKKDVRHATNHSAKEVDVTDDVSVDISQGETSATASADGMQSSKELEASKADFSSLLGDSTGLGSLHDESESDALFDFDDEDPEQDAEDDKEDRLTWRLDPTLSLSDWAIIVKNRRDGSTQSYHVHKNMLAVGPRKCEYFVKSFRNIAKSAVQNKSAWPVSCEIELEDVGAKAFPVFLDFIYSPDGALEIKTDNASGLRYLSNLFGIRLLHKRVMEYIQKDLTLGTLAVYYKDLHMLKDEKLLTNAAKYCAKNLLKIETHQSLIRHWDPSFLLQIMQSEYIDSKQRQLHLSLILAEYCKIRRGKLSANDFAMLTEEKVLPLVHYNAALPLMEVESDIVVATSLKNMLELTSLQKRCIKDLSTHWKELCDMDEGYVSRVSRKLPCSVVADLMMKSLSNARRRTHSDLSHDGGSDASTGKLRKGKKPLDPTIKLRKEYDAKLEDLKKQYEDQIDGLKKECEAKMYAARQQIAEKEKQVALCMQEIRNFERLPNSYDGKLAPTGKSHEPSLMPDGLKEKVEGMLLVTKKNGPKYPLFYYKREDPDLSHVSETSRKEQKP